MEVFFDKRWLFLLHRFIDVVAQNVEKFFAQSIILCGTKEKLFQCVKFEKMKKKYETIQTLMKNCSMEETT